MGKLGGNFLERREELAEAVARTVQIRMMEAKATCAETERVAIADALCVFCLHPVADARRMGCGHYCCRKCAGLHAERDALVRTALVDDPEEDAEPTLACGMCGRSMMLCDLELALGADATARDMEAGAEPRVCCAEGCAEKASVLCECCGELCKAHSDAVHALMPGHVRRDVSEEKWVWLFPKREAMCAKHADNLVSFYCLACKVRFCAKCMDEGLHKGHSVVAFDGPLDNVPLFAEARKKMLDIGEQVKDAEVKDSKECIVESIEKVQRIFAGVREKLDEKERSLVAEVEQLKTASGAARDKKEAALEKLRRKHAALMEAYQTAKKIGDKMLILNAIDQLKRFTAFYEDVKNAISSEVVIDVKDNSEEALKHTFVTVSMAVAVGGGMYVQGNPNIHLAPWRKTSYPTGYSDINGGGTVFDPVRGIAIEISYNFGHGKHICVNRVDANGTMTNEVKRNFVPFKVYIAPIFDGDRSVYFLEDDGRSVSCLNLDTMELAAIASTDSDINSQVYGFFAGGKLYAFTRSDGKLIEYDPATNTWVRKGWCAEKTYCNRYEPHPWDPTKLINLHDGNLSIVSLETGEKLETFPTFPARAHNIPETLVIALAGGHFLLCVCYGNPDSPWYVFSSATGSWQKADWPTTRTHSNSSFFSPKTSTLFYHVDGQDEWTEVSIPR